MIELLRQFLIAPQTIGVFSLILIDLATGIISAVRRGVFSWAKLGDVLTGPTLSYIGGYAAWWLVSRGGVEAAIAPFVGQPLATVIGQTLASTAAGFSVLALWASICANWRELRALSHPQTAPGQQAVSLWPDFEPPGPEDELKLIVQRLALGNTVDPAIAGSLYPIATRLAEAVKRLSVGSQVQTSVEKIADAVVQLYIVQHGLPAVGQAGNDRGAA